MTQIKVQGEVYDSPEEVLDAISTLEAKIEELPESSPGRADLERHIQRLREASGADAAVLPSTEEAAVGAVAETSPHSEATPPAPDGDEEEEEEDETEPGVAPGLKLCPVCRGAGTLPITPPIDPRNEVCPRCSGYGQVITGSHVTGHELLDCPDCQGQGYIARRSAYGAGGNGDKAASAPAWPGSTWDAIEEIWKPPPGNPPWTGAVWDEMKGTYA